MALLNLRHLYVFNIVATTGGVRRSSDTLLRDSSAVARSVAALESSLAVPLFERKGRGMLLTAAGEAVQLRVRRIENELREVRDDALRLSDRSGGQVAALDALFNERRLLAAVLLAEAHHMPSVARRMEVSPPAVSQAISLLEGLLGQSLFFRTAQGMLPTDAGRRWTEHFERALAELRHIPADIAALAGSVQGSVTIGTLPLVRYEILPRAIATLLHHHPGLHIRSLESPYEELSAGLMSGRIDFIIGSLRPFDSDTFVSMPLFTDKAVLTARVDHPLTRKKKIKLTDLADYPWVMAHAGTPLRTLLEEFFATQGVSWPSTAVETGDQALVRGLLCASDMLTVLSAHRLQHEVHSGALTALPFDLPGMERIIGVTLRKGAHLSPGATALLGEIENITTTLQQAA
ncbi:LysR family transcriptional regulator of gallate degradation [Herbaspirillum sp. Sphag1AN]|uniref:LysR family transcriptional regulator n=1 Tax=unclassified Herbaspirillum TaxID=2624150 RepID=UPI00161245E9|nr:MULTISPECIES: LysR family transcriptional regulator [unclassified Herbaspirillum]MBB3213534.1 LysR family transcriptional regulator of gallate degradation [Herbaspirillum sp. Sphag1AN]MBB3246732.1 LysR family transcriptional regulator of gallate degradation [Herbaspirillum sp. Sphag64]